MTRRLFSFVMILLTLNVSAAEALRACASQASHETAPRASHEDCDKTEKAPAPTATTCCDALSSCGPSISIDSAIDDEGVIPDRGTMGAGATRAPETLEQTPEPPPPKG